MLHHPLGYGFLALLALGCGSRSALLVSETTASGGGPSGGSAGVGGSLGGSGGAGGVAGTSGAGGSSGTGGVVTCAGFDLIGEPVGFESPASEDRYPPRLAFSNDALSGVGVVSSVLAAGIPGTGALTLRMTAFQPWNTWPTTLGQGAQSSFVVGVDQFALDRGTEDTSLAMTWPSAPSPPAPEPQGLFYSASVSAVGGSPAVVESLAIAGPPSHVSRFVRKGPSAHLVGFESSDGGHHGFHVSYAGDAVGTSTISDVGCATTPMSADAVSLPEGGFIFAFSTSRPWGNCMLDNGIDTPAHEILGGFMGGPGGGFGPIPLSIDEPSDIVGFVRLLPRPGGAWLIWEYQGVNAELPPPVMLMQLDPNGTPQSSPVAILEGGVFTGPPGFAALGERLAMAWLDTSDPFGGTIMLRILDASGQKQAERAYQPSASSVAPGLALLASPSFDQLLVGFSRTGNGVSTLEALVAKFCIPD